MGKGAKPTLIGSPVCGSSCRDDWRLCIGALGVSALGSAEYVSTCPMTSLANARSEGACHDRQDAAFLKCFGTFAELVTC